jgi:hypothetical protein
MEFLAARLKERSTWTGIGIIAGLVPMGVYSAQVQQGLALAQTHAPAVVDAVQQHNYVALITTLCVLIPGLLAIITPTTKH